MKALKITICILFFLVPVIAQADLVEELSGTRGLASVEEAIISESFTDKSDWDEPVFSTRGPQRDLASLRNLEASKSDVDWMGELEVQAELPFTYPVYTDTYLEMKTLNEIEAQEARKK